MKRFHLLGLLAFAMPVAPAAADTIGRLFFTPEQRAALERLRQNPNLAAVPVSDTLTVNGVVRRSSGETTVWINGVPQRLPGPSRGSKGQPPAEVPVTLPGIGKSTRAKVGQTVDSSTGTVTEKFQALPPKPAPEASKTKSAPSDRGED